MISRLPVPSLAAAFWLPVVVAVGATSDPVKPGEKESATGTVHNGALYARPDPASTGGLRLRPVSDAGRVRAVLATPRDDWKRVHFAAPDADGDCLFKNLPAGRYDLMVVCERGLFEGLQLSRRPDALRDEDRAAIRSALDKTNPFFETKRYERMEGGDGGARVLIQEMRLRPVTLQSAEVRKDVRIRSVKLALLTDVGPGWSVTDTRELLRTEVGPSETERGPLPCRHAPALSGVRVTDESRDLGEIRLAARAADARQARIQTDLSTSTTTHP